MTSFGSKMEELSDRRRLLIAEQQCDVAQIQRALVGRNASLRILALGALSRLGTLTRADVINALNDDNRDVRCRSLEVVCSGEIDRPEEFEIAARLHDDDDLVVETAAWALGEVYGETANDPGSAPIVLALCDVATSHEESICREAAIAALGAIGADAGVTAILEGLEDRAPVRRRAVLALAPFDERRVRSALEAATTDRDRQVRQAAEDLL